MSENQQPQIVPTAPTLTEFDKAIATLATQPRYQGTDTKSHNQALRDLLYGKKAVNAEAQRRALRADIQPSFEVEL